MNLKIKNGKTFSVDVVTKEKIVATVTPEQYASMITAFNVPDSLYQYEVVDTTGKPTSSYSDKKSVYSDYLNGVATFYLADADATQVTVASLNSRVRSLEETIDVLVLNSLGV